MSERPHDEMPADLNEAILDAETLEQLFIDLGACAKVFTVMARGAGGSQQTDLADGHAQLLAGRATALQIRYLHAGEEWWDTLMATPEGVRLVRINHG